MSGSAHRTYGIAIVLAVVVVMAGCSGFQSGSAQTESTATETLDEPTEAETETDADASVDTVSFGEEEDRGISGRLLLLVDGSDTHIGPSTTSESDGVWINESHTHRWHVENESTSLAAALGALGVEASSDSLVYENETYNDSENGTTVAYRVDGNVVEDPDEYVLEDGDEVHVTVFTENVTTPGREYSTHHPHAHGSLDATVDGEELNFSRERYVMNDDYFHFHGDEDGARWHAHSTNLTVSYAISSFDDFDVSDGAVTFDGATYDENETTITVNGDQVDPETYVLKDGDDLELVLEETE